ncbi:MAG: cytochrome c oxidase assembly protein [Actinomycetota bacterium]|nr:cytochrome c oxidase assembly protein [Actinomycetota bacterium]
MVAPPVLDAPVRLHVVLTGFQVDPATLIADATLALAIIGEIAATRHLRRRHRRAMARALALCAGITVLFVAVGSGVAAYDDTNAAMHVLQHLMLMMLAPPLLALGRPITTLAQAAPRPVQRLVVRVANSRAFGALGSVALWPVYFGAMWAAFLSPLYRLDLENSAVHDATHVGLVLIGYCYWQQVVGKEPAPRRATPARRALALLVGGPFEGALGVVLLVTPHPLFRSTLAATHLAGALFLVGAMLISGLALALVLYDWARQDEQRTRRLDAAVAAEELLVEASEATAWSASALNQRPPASSTPS